jgi:hypothetical protein
MGTKRFIVWVAVFSILALPVFAPAAEKGHDTQSGEKIFSGKVGPWTAEARLIDMKAQMEQSGVSAKTATRFAGKRHLMLFVTDPATGKTAAGVARKDRRHGPRQGFLLEGHPHCDG